MSTAPATSSVPLLLLRASAIVIALAAVVDPSFLREQRVRPELAVVVSDATVSATFVRDVRRALEKDFVTVQGTADGDALPNAAATVLLGSALPASPTVRAAFPSPVFAVTPPGSAERPRIVDVRYPASTLLDATARIEVDVERGDRGNATTDSLVLTLRDGSEASAGTDAAVLLDRVAVLPTSSRTTVALSFTPTRAGLAALQLGASVNGASVNGASVNGASVGNAISRADIGITVRDRRGAVLFHDARPSWMSTFVRRELERDPRLAVTSRVVTARGISTDAGRPPVDIAGLGGSAGAAFDVIVVGAPEALTTSEVNGLESFLRTRGGSVVLLLDQRAPGAVDRLTRASDWIVRSEPEDVALVRSGADSVAANSADIGAVLRATDWVSPRALPPGATALLSLASNRSAIVWRTPVGAGTLLVSGALDAWRFRDSTQSAFGEFWRNGIAGLADAAVPPIAVQIRPAVVRPGALLEVHAESRTRWNSAASLMLAASWDSAGGSPIRLWPDASPGSATGTRRVPNAPGRYRVVVTGSGEGLDETRTTTEFVVADSAIAPATVADASLHLWARTHGGAVLDASSLPSLSGALLEAVGPTQRIIPWYPMRSAWWIVPFAGLLAAEWWIRRRRGLA
jgi:hypothetical protein